MIKNIIFDFDGVICESVDIKTDAFYEMYLSYGEVIAQKVKEHHIQNGGMSRYDKFEHYEKEFIGEVLSDEKMQRLSTEFSNLVKQKVIAAPFVKGALEFLKDYSQNYQCFIVSATPIEEIQEITKEKNIDKYFQEVFGSPQNKIEWGKYILDSYKIQSDETLFIGDALSDYTAAKENHMNFLLRETNNQIILPANTLKIKDLKKLNLFIKSTRFAHE